MTNSRQEPITIYENGREQDASHDLIVEEPLSIRIEGEAYSLVMRSPGEEKAHVAGFCLSEGIVEKAGDIQTISFCEESGVNVATVTLQPERRREIAAVLNRKGFISQTSCGICGKEMAEDIRQMLTPAETTAPVRVNAVLDCVHQLSDHQALHQRTRSAHAAMVFDKKLRLLSFSEDVGRHNALDKAIGQVLLEGKIEAAQLGVMSSRLSYELVQKAARARMALLIGISRPTSLAVDLARSVNMTLGFARNNRLIIFCGRQRLIF